MLKKLTAILLISLFVFHPMAVLASEGDDLAVAIEEIVDDNSDELANLANILEIKDLSSMTREAQIIALNKEIRHAYGHTIANIGRTNFEPDYEVILDAVCKKLKLADKNTLLTMPITNKEEILFQYMLEETKKKIIAEKGEAEWERISVDIDKDAQKLLEEGKISKEDYDKFKAGFIGTTAVSGLVWANMSGLAVYQLGTSAFWAIVRGLGLHIGSASLYAGSITGVIGALIGPVGWLATGAYLIYSFGNTNWSKTCASISCIAVHNVQKRYKAELEALEAEKQAENGSVIETVKGLWQGAGLDGWGMVIIALLVIVALLLISFFTLKVIKRKRLQRNIPEPVFLPGTSNDTRQYTPQPMPQKSPNASNKIRVNDGVFTMRGIRGSFTGVNIPFHTFPALLGRDTKVCKVQFAANTPGVSRKHCEISYDGANFVVTDFSTYGTQLNGNRLAQNVATRLNNGDTLTLAGEVFQVIIQQ